MGPGLDSNILALEYSDMNKSLSYVLRAAFLVTILFQTAARRPELKFLEIKELPNAGLKFKLMSKAVEMPPPSPATVAYTFTDSQGNKTNKDMYDPRELWLYDQLAGTWRDEFGNILQLGILKYPIPSGFKHKHTEKNEFAEKISAPEIWSDEAIASWAASFTGAPGARTERLVKHGFNIKDAKRIHLQGNEQTIMFVFRLNKAAAGQALSSENYYAIRIILGKEVGATPALAAIETQLLPSITVPRMSAKHDVSASSQFQVKSTQSFVPVQRSETFEESRQEVIKSISNLKDWWFVETKNFIILSNLKTRFRPAVTELQHDIEYLRDAYEQFIPPFDEINAVSVIRVPETPEEYVSYVGAQMQWSAGMWVPSRRELVIRPTDWGSSRDQKLQMLRVAYHEAFHQYIFYAMSRIECSVWFNEGHACFFENVSINGRNLSIGESQMFLPVLEAIAKTGKMGISGLFTMDYKTFYSGSDQERFQKYALAWGLVYYLRKYVPKAPNSPYAKILPDYPEALKNSGNCTTATQTVLRGIDINAFDTDLAKFWSNRNMRATARQNRIFRDYVPRR